MLVDFDGNLNYSFYFCFNWFIWLSTRILEFCIFKSSSTNLNLKKKYNIWILNYTEFYANNKKDQFKFCYRSKKIQNRWVKCNKYTHIYIFGKSKSFLPVNETIQIAKNLLCFLPIDKTSNFGVFIIFLTKKNKHMLG